MRALLRRFANGQVASAPLSGHHSNAAVQTRGLQRTYDSAAALDGLNLMVPDGSAYLLAGTNGAGKSTLLRILLNMDQPTGGSVSVYGLDPRGHGPEVRAICGYLPEQADPGYAWMRVAQLLEHRAAYYPSWDRDYVSRLSCALELKCERPVGALSKGEARQVQIVMALGHRPRLLLLDEPTDGLDPVVRDKVLGLISDHLAANSCTMIVSTHLVSEVEPLVERVGVLHEGRLLAQDSCDRLVSSLKTYEVEAPEDWSPSTALADSLFCCDNGIGRSKRMVIRGDEERICLQLEADNVFVRSVKRQSLSRVVLQLLSAGHRS